MSQHEPDLEQCTSVLKRDDIDVLCAYMFLESGQALDCTRASEATHQNMASRFACVGASICSIVASALILISCNRLDVCVRMQSNARHCHATLQEIAIALHVFELFEELRNVSVLVSDKLVVTTTFMCACMQLQMRAIICACILKINLHEL